MAELGANLGDLLLWGMAIILLGSIIIAILLLVYGLIIKRK